MMMIRRTIRKCRILKIRKRKVRMMKSKMMMTKKLTGMKCHLIVILTS